jgi:hypothetical protein
MDFIEKIFGFSPDGGDGSLELLLFAVPVVLLIGSKLWQRWVRHQQVGKTAVRTAGPD